MSNHLVIKTISEKINYLTAVILLSNIIIASTDSTMPIIMYFFFNTASWKDD